MPHVASAFARAPRAPNASTGVGSVPMDVVVNFSSGSGALTAAALNAGTHGDNWGTWKEYHNGAEDAANTHTSIVNHAVAFPGALLCGGQRYDGSEGQGLTFDFASVPTEYDAYHMAITAPVTNCVAIYLVKFDTIVSTNSYNNDTVLLAGGTYTIAQYQLSFNSSRTIKAHSEGVLGAGIVVPYSWLIVCIHHDADGMQGQFFLQDASTLTVLGASRAAHLTPAGTLNYIRLQDYLRYAEAGTGSISVKLLAFRNRDLTWPPYAITVPSPTNISAAQTAANTITLTWTTTCQVFRVERNTNAGGWMIVQSAYDNSGAAPSTYIDATVSAGQSVQYRVSAKIGNQFSSTVTSNTVSVT